MTFKRFCKKVYSIIKKDNISNEYYMANNEYIEDCLNDIFLMFNKNNISDDDVDIILNKLISTSIATERSILDIMSNNDKFQIVNNNTINVYFDEVGKIYNNIDKNFANIEYCDDNRDLLIKSNLKTVIYIAKMYRNKGVDFEDLISAGNLGLCIAFDKFKPNNIKIRKLLIDILDNMDNFVFENNIKYFDSKYVFEKFSSVIKYGRLYNMLLNLVKKDRITYDELLNFINNKVCGARFNSVATMWIRAMILSELKNASLIKRPDSARIKSKRDEGIYNPDIFISINRSISDDNKNTIEDILETPSDSYNEFEYIDKRITIRNLLEKLMYNISTRDRRIFLKKFGVGLPRPLQPKEIAQQEDLSIARVSQIFQYVANTMKENAKLFNIDEDTINAIILND